ncbi:MAG: FG-GAP-like repeat-containing protein, partial [Bryobacteraceae bacterium]
MCTADFDLNGTLDLAAVDAGNFEILFGDPTTGAFSSPATFNSLEQLPVSMVAADVNADGWPDIIVANYDGSIGVFLAEPGQPGHFAPEVIYQVTTGASSNSTFSLLIADFNRDGLVDIASVGSQIGILLNEPATPGTFNVGTPVTTNGSGVAAVADFNGDGYPDVAVGLEDMAVEILYGDAAHPGQLQTAPSLTLTFPPIDGPGSSTIGSMVAADFNQDGAVDLAIGTTPPGSISSTNTAPLTPQSVAVVLNSVSQPGTFSTPTVYQTPGGVVSLQTEDVNGDGNLDLLTTECQYIAVAPGFGPPIAFVDPSSASIGLLLANASAPGSFLSDTTIAGTQSNTPFDTSLTVGRFGVMGLPGAAYVGTNGLASFTPSLQVIQFNAAATATLSPSVIPGVGEQTIAASYLGDSNYQGANTSAQFGASVATPTTTQILASGLLFDFGDSVTFTASVTVSQGANPTSGTIVFLDGSTALASVPITQQGLASYSTTGLAAGSHQISATYQPDGGLWLISTSASLTITVLQPGQTPHTSGGLLFVPITPCRVMDTRGNGFSGSFGTPSLTSSERDVPIPQSSCGIPSTALRANINETFLAAQIREPGEKEMNHER